MVHRLSAIALCGFAVVLLSTTGYSQDSSTLKKRETTDSSAAATPQVSNVTSTVDATSLTLEIVPASLKLHENATSTLFLAIRNSSAQEFTDVELFTINNLPVTVRLESASGQSGSSIAKLAAKSSELWSILVSQDKVTRAVGEVQIGVKYQWLDGAKVRHRDVKFVKLTLESPDKFVIADAATFTVVSTLDSVSQQQPGILHLALANTSNHKMVLNRITAHGPLANKANLGILSTTPVIPPTPTTPAAATSPPAAPQPTGSASSFILFEIPDWSAGPATSGGAIPFTSDRAMLINPGDTLIVPVRISTQKRISPGKYKLVFEANVSWDEGDPAYRGSATLLAPHELSAGVLGESTVFQYIGAPTMLFLPGFLIAIICRLMWNLGMPLIKGISECPLKPQDPSFYLFAITFSGIVAYTLSTFFQYDYLTSYGYTDLCIVWVISLAIGVGLYLLFWALMTGWFVAQWFRGRQISIRDSPEKMLKKLGLLKMSVIREGVTVALYGKHYNGYLMEDTTGQLLDNTRYIVVPQIQVQVPRPDAANKNAVKGLIDAINRERVLGGDSKRVSDAVMTLMSKHNAQVAWIHNADWIDKPYYVDASKLQLNPGDPQLLIVSQA